MWVQWVRANLKSLMDGDVARARDLLEEARGGQVAGEVTGLLERLKAVVGLLKLILRRSVFQRFVPTYVSVGAGRLRVLERMGHEANGEQEESDVDWGWDRANEEGSPPSPQYSPGSEEDAEGDEKEGSGEGDAEGDEEEGSEKEDSGGGKEEVSGDDKGKDGQESASGMGSGAGESDFGEEADFFFW